MHAVVARSTCRSQNAQNTPRSGHFWTLKRRFVWQAQGTLHPAKSEAGVGHLRRICKDAICRAGAVQETCSADMFRRQGADFHVWGCILEHQIFRFAKMILCDGCTSYDLASFFRGMQYFGQMEWKNLKTHCYEAVSSALKFPVLKEVSQNCFAFDVFNLEN